jgi:actin cytoskeleton-regulatory complex protein PAN1
MYSASNSFLGGANTARQQQQASPFQQQQQQQQPAGFPQHGLAPQPTGFPGGQQLQPQFTGFPGAPNPTGFQQPYGQPSLQPPQQQQPQLQPQFTGFPGAAPQNQFAPSQPSQAPQQQNAAPQQFPTASAAPPTIAVHKTSAQMAQSFIQDSSSSKPTPPPKSGPRMPNMRLSFITAEDQAKFEQLFKAAAGDDVTLDGRCFR